MAFSFGLSGAITSIPVLSQVGAAYVSPVGGKHYLLTATFKSTGNVSLVKVCVNGQNVPFYQKGNSSSQVLLHPGINALTLCLVPTASLLQGTYVNLELDFSNGESILVVAIYSQ